MMENVIKMEYYTQELFVKKNPEYILIISSSMGQSSTVAKKIESKTDEKSVKNKLLDLFIYY